MYYERSYKIDQVGDGIFTPVNPRKEKIYISKGATLDVKDISDLSEKKGKKAVGRLIIDPICWVKRPVNFGKPSEYGTDDLIFQAGSIIYDDGSTNPPNLRDIVAKATATYVEDMDSDGFSNGFSLLLTSKAQALLGLAP